MLNRESKRTGEKESEMNTQKRNEDQLRVFVFQFIPFVTFRIHRTNDSICGLYSHAQPHKWKM